MESDPGCGCCTAAIDYYQATGERKPIRRSVIPIFRLVVAAHDRRQLHDARRRGADCRLAMPACVPEEHPEWQTDDQPMVVVCGEEPTGLSTVRRPHTAARLRA